MLKKYCPQCMEPLTNGICKNGCTHVVSDDIRVLQPGTVLHNRYLIGRVLGQGGFGITYIGRDLTLETCVAVKEYFPTQMVIRDTSVSLEVRATSQRMNEILSQGYDKFLKEARVLARFRGEAGIVDVLDFFEENNTAYIVMEYVDGQTLRAYLDKSGNLPPDQVFSLIKPVMHSLNKLHQSGLIHRDISPDNIMLTANGQIKLLDFGTVRNANIDGENTLTVILKHGYAPEEQYDSKSVQGPWTDVYALCATMYRCITGIIPEYALLRRKNDPVQPPSQLGIAISSKQEAALMKGMSCDYENRFQSMGELAVALYEDKAEPPKKTHSVVSEEQTEVLYEENPVSPPDTPKTSKSKLSRKTLAIGGRVLAVLLLGLALTLISANSKPDNVLMSDILDLAVAEAVGIDDYGKYWVFESDYTRDQISTITFLNTLEEISDDAWDVSEAQDSSVMAWVKPNGSLYDLYIGAEGGVVAPADCSGMFRSYKSTKFINFNGSFDTANVTNMRLMFDGCESLTALDLSSFDTANVTNMVSMFVSCESLTTLDLSSFDTANVMYMVSMFGGCKSLTTLDLSSFDTAMVTDMGWMFGGCYNLTTLDLSSFDTAMVTDMDGMFDGCESLTTLDLSSFDTANVTDMGWMFYGCESLTTLDLSKFDTANVTDMSSMFYGCESLTTLDLSSFDISKVTDMNMMFYVCTNLTELRVRNWNASNADTLSMFAFCPLPEEFVTAILSGETVSN